MSIHGDASCCPQAIAAARDPAAPRALGGLSGRACRAFYHYATTPQHHEPAHPSPGRRHNGATACNRSCQAFGTASIYSMRLRPLLSPNFQHDPPLRTAITNEKHCRCND